MRLLLALLLVAKKGQTMRLLLASLLLAAPALAGSPYTLTNNPKGDADLTRGMNRSNKATCARFGLPNGCTQVQAREQFCRVAGFGGQRVSTPDPPRPDIITFTPLVSSCAGSTQVTIFPDVAAFAQSEWVQYPKDNYGKKSDDEDLAAFEALKKAASGAQKNAACLALGGTSGCLP